MEEREEKGGERKGRRGREEEKRREERRGKRREGKGRKIGDEKGVENKKDKFGWIKC